MYCKSCGNYMPEDSVFCPCCGARVKPVVAEVEKQEPNIPSNQNVAQNYNGYVAPPGHQNQWVNPGGYAPAVPKAKGVKNNAKIFIIIGIVSVIIIGLIIMVFPTETRKMYREGIKLYENGEYSDAMVIFEELGDYRESEEYYANSKFYFEAEPVYDDAEDEFRQLNYYEAKLKYQSISGYLDAEAKGLLCQQEIYKLAESNYKEEKYEQALKCYLLDTEYSDSIDKAEKCRQTIYQKAENFYNNKEFYKAMKVYESLENYKDAKKKAASCEQPLPGTGALKFGNGSSSDLQISVYGKLDASDHDKSDGVYDSILLRIYDSSGKRVGQTFIRSGGSTTISLNPGTYNFKVGCGKFWYGETDLFGEDGYYSQMVFNGDSTSLQILGNRIYSMSIGGATNGNMGAKSVANGAAGM